MIAGCSVLATAIAVSSLSGSLFAAPATSACPGPHRRSGDRSRRWPLPARAPRPAAPRRPNGWPRPAPRRCACLRRPRNASGRPAPAPRGTRGCAPQHRDLAVANDIHEGAGRIEQDVLLGVAQALVGGSHPRLGGAHVVPGLKTVEQPLLDLHAERTGGEAVAALRGVVDARMARDRRAPARLGDRHVLVGHAHAGAAEFSSNCSCTPWPARRPGSRRSSRRRKAVAAKSAAAKSSWLPTTTQPSSVSLEPAD